MQATMGIIRIPLERLQQWKATVRQLAVVISGLLSIDGEIEDRQRQTNIRLGMMKGKNGRRWLSLNKLPLTLEANDHRLPLEEALFFERDALAIDRARIIRLIDKAPSNVEKKYTPSTEKQEARKRRTEAMYADWQDAYLRFRRKYRNTRSHPDTWIAGQISKLPIAQDPGF